MKMMEMKTQTTMKEKIKSKKDATGCSPVDFGQLPFCVYLNGTRRRFMYSSGALGATVTNCRWDVSFSPCTGYSVVWFFINRVFNSARYVLAGYLATKRWQDIRMCRCHPYLTKYSSNVTFSDFTGYSNSYVFLLQRSYRLALSQKIVQVISNSDTFYFSKWQMLAGYSSAQFTGYSRLYN